MDPVTAVYLGATILAGGVAARSAHNAGKATEIQYKEQAKQEEVSARDREIERRRRLVQALSSQNAEAGAAGIDPTTGSRRAMTLEDARLAQMDSLTDRAMTNRRAINLRSAGRNARRQGDLQAAGSLLNTGASVADGWPGG